jgi:nucleotide-binding universal stress UspA family protein
VGYQKILAGVDGSATSMRALAQAAAIAKAQGSELVILTGYQPPDPEQMARWLKEVPKDVAGRLTGTSAVEEVLERAKEAAAKAGVEAKTRYETGDPADTVLRVAEEENVDLIIVGNKGMTGAKRFLLGSVPNKISHHSPCDVLIVRTT